MKMRIRFLPLLSLFFLISCSPPAASKSMVQTAIAETREVEESQWTSTPANTPTHTATVTVTNTPKPTRTPIPTKAPTLTITVTPEWLAPEFKVLCRRDDTMTDLQREKYLEGFVDKKVVDWMGWVYDVDESGYILISMEPSNSSLFWSRDIQTNQLPLDLVSQLKVEQRIKFSGTITEVGEFLGSICNPIYLHDVIIEVIQ